VRDVNIAREFMFTFLANEDEKAKVEQWRLDWNGLVEDEQRKFRKYFNVGFDSKTTMEKSAALSTLNLSEPKILNAKIITYAWETVVLPKHLGDEEHTVEKLKITNKALDVLFNEPSLDNIQINLWKETMPPQPGDVLLVDESSTLLDEPPATLELEQDQLDTGSLALKEQMMSQQTRIEAYETKIEAQQTKIEAQQLQFESMKNELADVKQVVKELLETVKGLKRIREDSDDDMSVESSVAAIKNQPRKDRKHLKKEGGSLNEDVKFKALEDEIKSFVAEEFEVKHGAHVLCSELYTIFRRSRGDGSDYEMNMFKYHVSKYFKIQWPTHISGRFKNIRCYYNVAVKTPPQ
jgi:hypothetical protein